MSNQINLLTFGKFTLDLQQQVLLSEGKHVPLAPKAYEILVTLVENRSRIVTKEELMARVWPDTVVEEINIAKNISLLRKILGNGNAGNDKTENGKDFDEKENGQSDQNAYIRTIPKRGYQFVYAVQEIEVSSLAASQQMSSLAVIGQASNSEQEIHPDETLLEPVTQKDKAVLRRWRYLALLATLVVIIMAAISFLPHKSSQQSKSIDVSKLRQNRLYSWKGGFVVDPGSVRASYDGSMIAFTKGDAEQTDIYVQQLAGGKTFAVTTEDWPDYSPIWSPNGQKIAYLSKRQNGNELWIVPSLGGKGEMIRPLGDTYLQLLRWSKDESKIFYVSTQDLFVLELNSGQVSRLTDFASVESPKSGTTVSDDERKIAYVQPVKGSTRIFVASLNGTSPVQLTDEGDHNVSPVWFADGNRILYQSTSNGVNQLCIAYLDGRKPIQLWSSYDDITPAHVSADGRKIFYVATSKGSDFFRRDLETEAEIQFTSDGTLKVWPDVSADGKTIVLQKAGNGFNVLHSSLLATNVGDAGANPELMELVTEGFDSRWSPLGDRLAFLRETKGIYHLWTVRKDAAEPKQLSTIGVMPNGFSTQPYDWSQPYNYHWSPDGKTLAFSAFQPPAMNIWRISADDRTEMMLTNNNDPAIKLISPIWSHDGKRLAYLAQTKASGKAPRSIMVYEDGQTRAIFQTESRLRMLGWSAQGDHFLAGLVAPEETGATSKLRLIRISLAQNEVEFLGEFPTTYFNRFRLSPDGEMLGYVSRQNNSDNIWVATLANGHQKVLTANTDPYQYLSGPAWLPNNKAFYFSKHSILTTIRSIENFE